MRARWRAKAGSRLPELAEAVAERARANGEVAFLLEPDLKESRGGLRDITAVRALATAWVADPPSAEVLAAGAVLLDVRGELHRRTGRDRLLLQEQTGHRRGARACPTSIVLARSVADAGRTVAYAWNTAWYRAVAQHQAAPLGRRARSCDAGWTRASWSTTARSRWPSPPTPRPIRCWCCARPAQPPSPTCRSRPHTLERLANESAPMPVPWPHEAREAFVGMLAAGPPAVAVVEALDHAGILVTLLPDWEHVRSTAAAQPVPPLHRRPASRRGRHQRGRADPLP